MSAKTARDRCCGAQRDSPYAMKGQSLATSARLSNVWRMGYGRVVMRMTATEAARHFSAVLGRVAAGEEIEVVRDGAAVAVIAPPADRSASARNVRELLWSVPDLDGSFADDLRTLQAALKAPPDAWR
jgi:prevent-host-death family protein